MTKTKLISAGLMAAALSVASGCTSTPLILDGPVYHPNGDYKKHDNHKNKNKHNSHKNKGYKNTNKKANAERLATRKLNSMGYRVEKLDYKEKQGIVKAKAYRGGSKYKIDLSYPSMQVINMKKD
ncbi:hypothetical protein [Psychrobacter sanguinis]|uniref:hypothetical protein n=1 Tax=Psychrobacter sanguinis TaxID=861445 RepID=UPI00289C178E|nr:hypothetical protein [Psychrobacter sanguinis]